jgi:hypothetical protein
LRNTVPRSTFKRSPGVWFGVKLMAGRYQPALRQEVVWPHPILRVAVQRDMRELNDGMVNLAKITFVVDNRNACLPLAITTCRWNSRITSLMMARVYGRRLVRRASSVSREPGAVGSLPSTASCSARSHANNSGFFDRGWKQYTGRSHSRHNPRR